ncbi:MAG: serine/threonine protein phosphatase [Acetobacteraceae bacterium]|nr:serine/threonine protein phosphatase [Acetobacteraceae bacterium]
MISLSLAPATLPPGERVYAIGDVHGCADRLAAMHRLIAADRLHRPVERVTVVHLGDLIDRGPDSAGAIALLAQSWPDPDTAVVNLVGNHEDMMLQAVASGDADAAELWLANGGDESLRSWGIDPRTPPRHWWGRIPPVHLGLLRGLSLTHRSGGYLFVHAGIRPDRPLELQRRHDLLWIREPFLSWGGGLPAVVVHGHTPAGEPSVRPHRIGVDTGAAFGGPLTCAVLERETVGFLQT